MNIYDSKSITVIKDDIKRIQKQMTMYIGCTDEKAFLHIIKEVLQNSVDEADEGGCTSVTVYYNEKTKEINIIDNGRGMPQERLIDLCTVLHSTGKESKGGKKAYKKAAGTHGVGLKAANALSIYTEVISYRDGKAYRVYFEEGVLIEEGVIEKIPKKQTGTFIRFVPNSKYIGSCNLDPNDLAYLCEVMAYLEPKIEVNFLLDNKKGKRKEFRYKAKNGINDYVTKLAGDDKLVTKKPINFFFENKEETMSVNVSLTYTADSMEEQIVSFANYCTTIDGGTHVKGFKQGLTTVMTNYIKDNILTAKEKSNMNISSDDVRCGLVAVIDAFHINARFSGQIKEKIITEDLVPFVRKSVIKGLSDYFAENPKEAKKIGTFVKDAAKHRNKAQQIRSAQVKGQSSFFDDDCPKGYVPPVGKKRGYRELIIIEGDSAGGSAKKCRNKVYQGLYKLKGIPTNSYDEPWYKVLEKSEELRGLVTALGCGIGPTFDINKLEFDRIYIGSDADIDGGKITSLVSTFFIRHMPELVKSKKIFRLLPPLYGIKEKGKMKYVQDNREYYDLMETILSKKITVRTINDKKLNSDEIKDLLYKNRQYIRTLTKASNRTCLNKTLLEYVVYYRNDIKSLKKLFKHDNRYKFMNITESGKDIIIDGTCDKEINYVILNDKFIDKTSKLIDYIEDINDHHLLFHVNDETKTLGELLGLMISLEPDKTRYKGLGEMDPEQLWETTLDPEKRCSVRLTSDDIKRDVDNFKVLHSEKAGQERKVLMANFKLNFEDIDT